MQIINNVHAHGHRQRARAKFQESQRQRTKQEDYEILELLLAFTILRKDTKPIAKNLLSSFHSIKNIFNVEDKELKNIKDVGNSTIAFLNVEYEFINRATKINDKACAKPLSGETLTSYAHFAHNKLSPTTKEFWLICLGSNARFLSCIKIENIENLEKPFEDMRPFVHAALNANAKSVIIFSNRLNVSLHVSYEELEESEKIKNIFKSLSINLHEYIIISANKAILIFLQKHLNIENSINIKEIQHEYIFFEKEKIKNKINASSKEEFIYFNDYEILGFLLYRAGFKQDIEKIINLFMQNSINIKNILACKFTEIENALAKDFKDKAFYEKLLLFIDLQRELVLRYLYADYYISPLSKRKSINKLEDLAHVAYFLLSHCQREEIWLAHFNKDKKMIQFEMVSVQGLSVASTDISYLVTRILHYKSASVVVCHNHPGGSIEASNKDKTSTKELAQVLKSLNISLIEHIIVADRSCTFIIGNRVLYF